MKLSAAENSLPGETLQEKFEAVLAAGFDGIELAGPGGGRFKARVDEFARARADGVAMSSAVTHTGIFIGSLDPGVRRAAIDEMKDLLSTVAVAGGGGVVSPHTFGVFSRKLPPFDVPRPDDQSRALLVEALAELGRHADGEGVYLFLEPLNRYEDWMVNTLSEAKAFIEEADAPGLAVVADTYHMSIEEDDIGKNIRACGHLIRHVQLGDSNRLEPGAGHYDWPETLRALDDIGYDGWLAMECGLSGPAPEVLPGVARLLRSRS